MAVPLLSAQATLIADQLTNPTTAIVITGEEASSDRASRRDRVAWAANHDRNRIRPATLMKLTAPLPAFTTSRNDRIVNRNRPTVKSAITAAAKVTPSAAATPSRGWIPAATPTHKAIRNANPITRRFRAAETL